MGGNDGRKIVEFGDGRTIDGIDLIAGLESCLLGVLPVDAVDKDSGAASEEGVDTSEGVIGRGRRAFLIGHSGRRLSADITLVDQLLSAVGSCVDRDGEAQSLDIGAGGFGYDQADQLAASVEETAAGVARVDGAVGLQQMHGLAVNGKLSVRRADDARGDCAAQLSQRISDGDGHVADFQFAAVPVGGRGEAVRVDLQDRHIIGIIGPDQLGLVFFLIGCRDLDLAGVLDDVVVGHDIAIFADDNAASRAFRDVGLHPGVRGDALGPDLDDAVLGRGGDLLDGHIASGSALQSVARRMGPCA